MSDSWRLSVNEVDQSHTIQQDVGEKGAMVIAAPKGTLVPTYFSKGNPQSILDQIGYPSATYPEIMDALDFNNNSGLWISAPFEATALYGGAIVLQTGTQPLSLGISAPSAFSFAEVGSSIQTTTTNYTTYNVTLPVTNFPYTTQSIKVFKNGVSITAVASAPVSGVETITGTGLTTGSQITDATGVVVLVFTAANLATDVITVQWASNLSTTAYFAFFSASPRTDDELMQVSYNTTNKLFTVNVYMVDNRGFTQLKQTYVVSNIPNTFNGYNQNVFMGTYISPTDSYVIPVANTTLVYSTFTADTNPVSFGGGMRGAAVMLADRTAGWAYFQQKNTYPADIFMDTSADPGIPPLFVTLRSTYQKYRSYIYPLPYNTSVATAQTTQTGFSINSRGLSVYWNWFLVREPFNGTSFYIPLIGQVGSKYAAMQNIYNGGAPAWIDENGHGGQLGVGMCQILSANIDPSESDLQTLDGAGINPIIFDPTYGAMIVSDKTCQTPAILSDTSYIPHSRLFDYIIDQTIKQVLVFQIVKLNDAYHQQLATSLAQTLISPILALGLLNTAIPLCNSTNNTQDVLAQRQFVFTWGIKVTPYSEMIVFNFVYVNQTVSVSAAIGASSTPGQ